MIRLVPFALSVSVGLLAVGCRPQAPPSPPAAPLPQNPPVVEGALSSRYPAAAPSVGHSVRPAPEVVRRPAPAPFPITGTWVPSGWMGDAHPMFGALSYRVTDDDAPADEWTYDPKRGQQKWAAVAYQNPDLNFGEEKGKDLSGKGYDRLTFKARSKEGIVRVMFKSGGHTARSARYPASYEAGTNPVSLGTEWQEVTIPITGDLSNIPAALVLVFSEQLSPRGGTVQIRDATFRGSAE